MKKKLLILLIAGGPLSFGQYKQQFYTNKSIHNGVDFSDQNYNSLKLINERNQFFEVNLVIPRNKEVYRFWNTRYCIEISKTGTELEGKVFYAIQNLSDKTEIFRKKFLLSKEQTQHIFKLIQEYGIIQLPTDSKIEGWKKGFDGNLLDIESNVNKIYTYKSYWTPSIQNIPEAKLVLNFFEHIGNAVHSDNLIKTFDSEHHYLSYRYWGTHYSIVKVLTKKEARKLRKSNKTARKRRPVTSSYQSSGSSAS